MSDQTCTQAIKLAVFFPLTTARAGAGVGSHWGSLGSPDISTTYFVRPLKKGAVDLIIAHGKMLLTQ